MGNKNFNIENKKIIICTFPKRGNHDFSDFFPKGEATIINFPLIETKAINFQFPNPVEKYDWIIFTSKNAVEPFFNKAGKTSNKIAAIGKSTSEELKSFGYNVEYTGKGYSAVYFLRELKTIINKNQRILLALGNLTPDTLQKNLSSENIVERVNVYKTQKTTNINSSVINRINEDRYGVILLTSPSATDHLFSLFPKKSLRIISIGETTTKAIKTYNTEPVATAIIPGYRQLAQSAITYLSKVNR